METRVQGKGEIPCTDVHCSEILPSTSNGGHTEQNGDHVLGMLVRCEALEFETGV